jgi:hypothetical protein
MAMPSPPLNPSSPYSIHATPASRRPPILRPKEQEYVEKLKAFSLNFILDQGPGEKTCKELGQEIFDYFKNLPSGSSLQGKKAMQNICNALWFLQSDGPLRKQYVERAWDGVGDSYERWMA